MVYTYTAYCSDMGDIRPGVYLRSDGVTVAANDPDAQAWLAAGNVPQPSVAYVQRTTTEQFILALKDLNLLAVWHAAITKAKQADQDRWALRGKGTILPINNPVLTRIAALAVPPIDLGAVFTQAASE